jgi:hypothetical protein
MEVAMPFGPNPPVEGASTTQERGARIWLTETLQPALHEVSDRELGQLAAELLAAATRLGERGNQAANALVGMFWARGIDIDVLNIDPDP